MPRVRSAGSTAAQQQHQQLAAAQAGLGGLHLSAAAADATHPTASAADAAIDAFAGGRAYRAWGHDARVFDLAFHPACSSLLISASGKPMHIGLEYITDDCSAGVWRRQQGGGAGGGRYMQVAAFQGHADSVMRAAWSPDGEMVASGSSDGVVCLWRPREAALTARRNLGHAGTQELARLEGHPEEVYACAFLPSSSGGSSSGDGHGSGSGGSGAGLGGPAAGQRLVTASGESLFLWDLATHKLLHTAQPAPAPMPERWRPGYLFGVAAQPDGPLLGAACSDGRLRLWAREGGDSALAPLCTLPWNQAMGSDCVFGPNGLFCATSKDGSVIMMDLRQGAALQHLQLDAPLLSCSLLRSGGGGPGGGGGLCLVAAGADGGVHCVDVASGDVASLCPEAGPARPLLCAAVSADGASLAASGESVVLDASVDLAGGEQPAAAAAGHQPLRKWSPIHIWRRDAQSPP